VRGSGKERQGVRELDEQSGVLCEEEVQRER
jgi:hypothetical protein